MRLWRWRDEATGVVTVGFIGLCLILLLPYLLPGTRFVHLEQGWLHAGVGFVLCALVLFALHARLRAALSLAAGVWLLGSIALFAWHASAAHTPQREPDFKLISFNMLGTNPRGAEIADYLIDEAPDVVFALEALAISDELPRIEAAFLHHAGCWPGPRCDMAIYARHPLRDVQIIPFHTVDGRLIVARVQLGGQTITLVAAHLTKPYWGIWHSLQLDTLMDVLATIDGPMVLAGDFNSQPFVRALRRHLVGGSGLRLASTMQPTWPALDSRVLSAAGFAIDHVFVRGPITPVDVQVIDSPLGSNHRGLVSTFDLDGL